MRQLGYTLGLAVLLGGAPALAATWTCTKKSEAILADAYFVVSHCAASGTYTTGGDPVTAADGCGSAARRPLLGLVSNTANAAGSTTYVATFDATAGKINLATAGATPGSGTPLAEVAGGTTITGFTLRALAWCK